MLIKSEVQSSLTAELRIISTWVYGGAALVFICALISFNLVVAGQPDAPPAWARALLGLMLGSVLGSYPLLIGYVNRDAVRRGMSAALWTFVAIFIPSGFGIILYFILRPPIPGAFAQAGTASSASPGSCPRCGYQLSPSCPHCQRVVDLSDSYCRSCGTALHIPAVQVP